MTETFTTTPTDMAANRLQVVAALLLGMAATFTAISVYESDQYGGAALRGYTNSTRALNDSTAFYDQANQQVAMDQQLFVEWATANHDGDEDKADFVFSMMRPELKKASLWWEKTGRKQPPLDPLTKGNPYDVSDYYDANDNETRAHRLYKSAVLADQQGGKFEVATVLFALTLFFGGISTMFKRRRTSVVLLGMATLTLVLGVAQLLLAFTS